MADIGRHGLVRAGPFATGKYASHSLQVAYSATNAPCISNRRCAACWRLEPWDCENKEYTGPPIELGIVPANVPASAAARMNQAAHNRDTVARAKEAKCGSVVCVETHKEEQSFPWVLGYITPTVYTATTVPRAYNADTDPIRFDPVKVNNEVLEIQLYEALEPRSSTSCRTPSWWLLHDGAGGQYAAR